MSAVEYARLVDVYKSTKGHAVYWQVAAVAASHAIFLGNHNELIRRIHTGIKLSDVAHLVSSGHRMELEAEFHEITRLLHNYVASIKSLVDHTRRISVSLLDPVALQVYQSRVDSEFKDNQPTIFLHDLRNYFLHVAHPSVSLVIQARGSSLVVEYQLSPQELLQWNGWRKQSVKMMSKINVGIPLGSLVEEYERKVYDFYTWLISHLNYARQADLSEFWKRHYEWAHFCKSKGIPITDEEMRQFARRDGRIARVSEDENAERPG